MSASVVSLYQAQVFTADFQHIRCWYIVDRTIGPQPFYGKVMPRYSRLVRRPHVVV